MIPGRPIPLLGLFSGHLACGDLKDGMRTVGRHRKRNAPLFEYTSHCAYCGALWHRSDMVRESNGWLRCPRHGNGMTRIEADAANARARPVPLIPPERDEAVAYYGPTELSDFTPHDVSPYFWFDPEHPRLKYKSTATELPNMGSDGGGLQIQSGYTAPAIDSTTYSKPVLTFTGYELFSSAATPSLQRYGNGLTNFEIWGVTKLSGFGSSGTYSYLTSLATTDGSSTVYLAVLNNNQFPGASFRNAASTSFGTFGDQAISTGSVLVWRGQYDFSSPEIAVDVGDSTGSVTSAITKPYGRESTIMHVGNFFYSKGNGLAGDVGPILITPQLTAVEATSMTTYLTNWMS